MLSSTLCFALASYLLLVRMLRYRRLKELEAAFGPRISQMTPAIAQKIVHISLFYETPTTLLLGTQVALFKAWGIPSVASLQLTGNRIRSPEALSQRLSDSAILAATWITSPLVGPGSGAEQYDEGSYESIDPRGAIAIARTNWVHRKYPIKMDDYRYNLALFILEPISWTERFAWRSHSEVEKEAFFVFWIEIGRRMGIEGLWSSLEEMTEWTEDYEIAHMQPSEPSAEIAQIVIDHFSRRIPNFFGLRRLTTQIVACLLDQRTRHAMQIPQPPQFLIHCVNVIGGFISFWVRNFHLPRRRPALYVTTADPTATYLAGLKAGELPRMPSVYKRKTGPWYYPEPTGFKKVLQDVWVSLGLLSPDKLPGKQWRSEGYRLEELGPHQFLKKGHEEVMRMAEEIQGGPVKGPWSLDGR